MRLLCLLCVFTALTALPASAYESEVVPPEYYLARVPDLPVVGAHRASWGFLRPPFLWIQGQMLRLDQITLPLWERSHSPAFLPPVPGGRTWIIVEDAEGQTIEALPLDRPFVPEEYEKKSPRPPASYRLQAELSPPRIRITTRAYPWLTRRVMVECSVPLSEESSLEKASEIKNCLEGLEGVAASKDRQWFVRIRWPKSRGRVENQFIGAQERTLKAGLRSGGHFFESERGKTREFHAVAGVTPNAQLPEISFPILGWPKADFLQASPTREEKQKNIHEASLENGERLEIRAFAADTIEERDLTSPAGIRPPINVQFIQGTGAEGGYSLMSTNFREARSGLEGALRPWEFILYGSLNQITSNRGERDTIPGLPSIRGSYKSPWWSLTPALRFESGASHPGTSLAISDLLLTVRRPLWENSPLEISLGLQQYALSGENPGSSRLGRLEAGVAGLVLQKRFENYWTRVAAHGFLVSPTGYDTEFELGRFVKAGEREYYFGLGVGSARYASQVENRVRVLEEFTEDRLKVSLLFGLIGADYFGR